MKFLLRLSHGVCTLLYLSLVLRFIVEIMAPGGAHTENIFAVINPFLPFLYGLTGVFIAPIEHFLREDLTFLFQQNPDWFPSVSVQHFVEFFYSWTKPLYLPAPEKALPTHAYEDLNSVLPGKLNWLILITLVFWRLVEMLINQLYWQATKPKPIRSHTPPPMDQGFVGQQPSRMMSYTTQQTIPTYSNSYHFQPVFSSNTFPPEVTQKDPITHLFNKAYFFNQLQQQVVQAKAQQHCLGLALWSLDYFKEINETYGIDVGDQLLYNIARLIQQEIPATEGIACRYSGDELAVILPHTNPTQALAYVEAICQKASQVRLGAYPDIQITLTGGLFTTQFSQSNSRNLEIQQLLSEAEKAKYQAKQQGRNQIQHRHLD